MRVRGDDAPAARQVIRAARWALAAWVVLAATSVVALAAAAPPTPTATPAKQPPAAQPAKRPPPKSPAKAPPAKAAAPKAAPKKAAPAARAPAKNAKRSKKTKRPVPRAGKAHKPHKPHKSAAKFDAEYATHPSAIYGAMSASACLRELDARSVPYAAVAKAPGVLAPVRLRGPVAGVTFRTEAAAKTRATSPYEVFDCRLVLALHDWAKVLVAKGIDEVHMFSAWRPPAKTWPADKQAKRHPGGLAIDVYRFVKKAGSGGDVEKLEIERDWHGAIGQVACGDGAAVPSDAAAVELRALVCGAADKHTFTSILTPNYDRAHFNHLHLEVTPEVTWHLVQ